MALVDRIQERYSVQRLAEVTNPDVPAAAAVNAARLAAAAADAQGDFQRIVGIAYDEAVPSHIGPAVRRAYARLIEYMDPAGAFAKALIDDTREEMSALRSKLGPGVHAASAADAVANAAADFLRVVGIAYDAAIATHFAVVSRRQHALLMMYSDPTSDSWKALLAESDDDLLAARAQIGIGARFTPVTDSVLSPSRLDTSSGTPIRPDFDSERFADYIPDANPRDPNS